MGWKDGAALLGKVGAVAAAAAAVGYVRGPSFTMGLFGALGIVTISCRRTAKLLAQDEQLVIKGFKSSRVASGPGLKLLAPFGYVSCRVRKGIPLTEMQYVHVTNRLDGSVRLEKGPQLLFLGPYDEDKDIRESVSIKADQYCLVRNHLTGDVAVVVGPTVVTCKPNETVDTCNAKNLGPTDYIHVLDHRTGERALVRGPKVWSPPHALIKCVAGPSKAVVLRSDEYVVLLNRQTGKRWVERGEATIFPLPSWEILNGLQKAINLKSYEYVRLLDRETGHITVHRGEQTVFPGPDEECVDGGALKAVELKVNEYVKFVDQSTGRIRVVRGPDLVFLEPNDRMMGKGKQAAIEIDDDHAVLVRDKTSGQLRLITEKQLFFPGPDEVIEEVRELIKLADHEAVIVQDIEGKYTFYYGSEEKRQAGQPRAFFLPPHAQLATMCWSRGRKREVRDLYIQRFDCRAQFMNFEFMCRTLDNVELELEGTFFWEVCDLPQMISTTGDAPGDICAQARSRFIEFVSQVSLKEFMASLHTIAQQVFESDKEFYDVRGLKIHSLEVTRYACVEKSTSKILQEIIQETTNRMNRLSQAEGENEVSMFKMEGEIEQETLNSGLLKITEEHQLEEAAVQGTALGERAREFVQGLIEDVPDLQERLALWTEGRKGEALKKATDGNAALRFVPTAAKVVLQTAG